MAADEPIRNCYIMLHIRPGPPYPDPVTSPQIAATSRFQLTSDVWIEKLEAGFAKRIQRACEPANLNLDETLWDRHLYAFVRRISPQEAPQYQGLNELFTMIALSRLIHPTSTGERYCAMILPQATDDVMRIKAIQTAGVCPDVLLGDLSRDWLSPDDGVELQKLLPWVPTTKKMHPRVHHAFWKHEQAMRTYYLDLRWTLIVSGFEALTVVDDTNVTKQFIRRVGKLAADFGILITDDELQRAYKLRSKLAHGQDFLFSLHAVLPSDKHRPLYDKLESLLRAVIKKSLLDGTYGNNFADKDAIRKMCP